MKRSPSPKTRNEALELAMKRGQNKALGKADTDSEDEKPLPQRAAVSPKKKATASPSTRNEALEMAMKRGQQKAGVTKDEDDADDDDKRSSSSTASKQSSTAPAQAPKSRNEALEMAMARGRSKAGIAGDDPVAIGSPEHGNKRCGALLPDEN